MDQNIEAIRRCENHWRELFAVKHPFLNHVFRWHNEKLSDQYTTNAFCSDETLNREKVQAAETYQREKNLRFLQLMLRQPLSPEVAREFSFEEELVLTMMLQKDSKMWKSNSAVQVKDVQTDDIAADLIDFHLKQEEEALKQSDYAKRQILQDMDAAVIYPEYHWLAAYLNGKIVGICHALCYAGCVEIDDLVVDEAARKQYVATTLLKHVAEQFDGIKYLHADAEGSAKEIYEKLGFVAVDHCWEYRKTW